MCENVGKFRAGTRAHQIPEGLDGCHNVCDRNYPAVRTDVTDAVTSKRVAFTRVSFSNSSQPRLIVTPKYKSETP